MTDVKREADSQVKEPDFKKHKSNLEYYFNLLEFATGGRESACFTEQQAGINNFVLDQVCVQGKVKAKISDFLVSEINKKGDVAKVTKTEYSNSELLQLNGIEVDKEMSESEAEDNLKQIFGEEVFDKILKLEKGDDSVKAEVAKEHRKKAHESLRKLFNKKRVSSVKDGVFYVSHSKDTHVFDARGNM